MGDMRPICQLYPKIKEDIELWMRTSDDGIYSKGFGDWCLPNDNTWNGIGACKTAVNTSLLYCYCCILEEIAGILHHEEDQKCCRVWKQTIRHSFAEHCINADGTVLSDRQPDLILPLYFGVLDGELQDHVLKMLLKKVEEDGHLDTGGFGANTASTRPSARSKPATSTERIGHAHGALYHTTSATIPAGAFPPP